MVEVRFIHSVGASDAQHSWARSWDHHLPLDVKNVFLILCKISVGAPTLVSLVKENLVKINVLLANLAHFTTTLLELRMILVLGIRKDVLYVRVEALQIAMNSSPQINVNVAHTP